MSAEQFSNGAQTTLNAAIGSADTSITVVSASAFPIMPQYRVQIESELMLVTAISGTTWTVTRGIESTTPAAHGNGTTVAGVLSAGALGGSSDAAAGTPSLRSLGSGATQAVAGNDSRLSDARTPTGAAGGDLGGTYPNPSVSRVHGVSFPASPGMNTVPVCTSSNNVTWESVPNTALQNSSVTLTAGSGLTGGGTVALGAAETIGVATNGITNSMLAQMPSNSLKGNNSGATANAADLTASQVQTLLSIPSISTGADASRPAPGTAGRQYITTDTFTVWFDTGSAWVALGAPPGSLKSFSGTTAPNGYHFCDASAISRTTYATLYGIITFTQTGSTSNGSASVTGLSSTSNMYVGMPVEGTGIPNGTTITVINSSSAITLSNTATASGTPTLRFFPFGNGDGSSTFNVPDMRGRVAIGTGTPTTYTKGLAGQTGGEESHVLTITEMPAHTHGYSLTPAGGLAAGGNYNFTQAANYLTTSTGGGGAHNNMQPYMVSNFIIKL